MTMLEGRPGLPAPALPAPVPVARPAAPPAPSVASTRERTEELRRIRAAVHDGPSERATAAQRKKGKLTVRERLAVLLDEGSFTELEALRRHRSTSFGLENRRPHGDGVVIGWGTIEGRKVFVYAHDFRVFGGSLGEAHAAKIHKIMDLAEAAGAPLIGLNDGAGARIQEGVQALAGYGGIFLRSVRNSGVIPQISVMLGPCAGGAAYAPALTDAIFMVKGISQMFITGPDVVTTVTGETIDAEGLGGAQVHSEVSGVATVVHDDETSCLEDVRYYVSMLPSNNRECPPVVETDDQADRRNEALLDLVPADPRAPYDMRRVIEEIVDDGEFFEIQEGFGRSLLCVLARIDGHVVGILANQPLVLAGVLDVPASQKGARFVQLCDSFNIPLVTLVDVPGFLPGTTQEHGGIIRHGAKLLYAYCAATVPRVQVILRKAYGGAYIVMDSRSIGCDVSFAWPINEIAVMGAEGAVNVIFRKEIAAADDPELARAQKTQEYREQLMEPYYAAERGLVDDVIDPASTRAVLATTLETLRDKHVPLIHRKHGNMPI